MCSRKRKTKEKNDRNHNPKQKEKRWGFGILKNVWVQDFLQNPLLFFARFGFGYVVHMVWFHSCGRETQFERGGLDTKGNGEEKKEGETKTHKIGREDIPAFCKTP